MHLPGKLICHQTYFRLMGQPSWMFHVSVLTLDLITAISPHYPCPPLLKYLIVSDLVSKSPQGSVKDVHAQIWGILQILVLVPLTGLFFFLLITLISAHWTAALYSRRNVRLLSCSLFASLIFSKEKKSTIVMSLLPPCMSLVSAGHRFSVYRPGRLELRCCYEDYFTSIFEWMRDPADRVWCMLWRQTLFTQPLCVSCMKAFVTLGSILSVHFTVILCMLLGEVAIGASFSSLLLPFLSSLPLHQPCCFSSFLFLISRFPPFTFL